MAAADVTVCGRREKRCINPAVTQHIVVTNANMIVLSIRKSRHVRRVAYEYEIPKTTIDDSEKTINAAYSNSIAKNDVKKGSAMQMTAVPTAIITTRPRRYAGLSSSFM